MRRNRFYNDDFEDYRDDSRYNNPDDTENTNARGYQGADEFVDVSADNRTATGGRTHGRHRRENRNYRVRIGDRIHNAWDRFSNHEDEDYASEYDNARLEREYAEAGEFGFGYSRYPHLDYGDYSSGPDDDFEYYEDLRHRAYDDTRYGREGGYSDVWRGERNREWIRNPRRRVRERYED